MVKNDRARQMKMSTRHCLQYIQVSTGAGTFLTFRRFNLPNRGPLDFSFPWFDPLVEPRFVLITDWDPHGSSYFGDNPTEHGAERCRCWQPIMYCNTAFMHDALLKAWAIPPGLCFWGADSATFRLKPFFTTKSYYFLFPRFSPAGFRTANGNDN